jgi:hypothetical protein
MKTERATKTERVQLGERDLDLLCDLLTYGAMLPEHLQALFFPGRSRRRLNQRLSQLIAQGLVTRRPVPLGLGAGLPPFAGVLPLVYGLGTAASPMVAARLGWDVADVRRLARLGTPTALAHTLAVVTLRVQSERAAREYRGPGGPVRLKFSPERLVRHDYQVRTPGGTWRGESFRPDALLTLFFGNGPWRHYFVEADLGHTSAGEWEAKARIAVRYGSSGLFAKRYGADAFHVLVVTTGERRLANLRRLLGKCLAPRDATRFGLATYQDVAARGPLEAEWHVPGVERATSLEAWTDPEPGRIDGKAGAACSA